MTLMNLITRQNPDESDTDEDGLDDSLKLTSIPVTQRILTLMGRE